MRRGGAGEPRPWAQSVAGSMCTQLMVANHQIECPACTHLRIVHDISRHAHAAIMGQAAHTARFVQAVLHSAAVAGSVPGWV
jgi:hypothetical protein